MPNLLKLEYNDISIIIMKGSVRHPPLFALALVSLKVKIFVQINNLPGGIPVQLWLTVLVKFGAFCITHSILKNKLNTFFYNLMAILAAYQMTQK